MRREPAIRRIFRLVLGKPPLEADLADELQFHLEMRADALQREGHSPAEARAEAERAFGDRAEVTRECLQIDRKRERDMKRRDFFEGVLGDLRFSVRSLRRTPAFALTAIVTLALCIGATTAIFSVVNGVLLQPLPYPEPDRLVRLWQVSTERGHDRHSISKQDLEDWRARHRGFESIGGFFYAGGLTGEVLSLRDQRPERVAAAYVDEGFFPTLRAQPALGRWPEDAEHLPGDNFVVVLSHALWKRAFAGDPQVLGTTITLSGEPFTVVGVAPPSFPVPGQDAEIFLPRSIITEEEVGQTRGSRWLGAVARLAPGVALETAHRELDGIARELAAEHLEDRDFERTTVLSLHEAVVGKVETGLLLILCATAFILLIACVNIANLMLARAAVREREVAVRIALGASRWRVFRQVLTETLLLSLAGGTLGLLLAAGALPLVLALSESLLPRLETVEMDGAVFAFTAALSVLTGVVFALLPALRFPADAVHGLLKSVRVSQAGTRTRSALVVMEVALAVVLVAGASLSLRSVWALMNVELGFVPENATVLTYSIAVTPELEIEDVPRRHAALLEAARAVPGVEVVGGSKVLPLEGQGELLPYAIPGRDPPAGGVLPQVNFQHVTPGFLGAAGISLLRGRDFDGTDGWGAPFRVLCNEAFARQHFGSLEIIGQSFTLGGGEAEIIGVVGDVRQARLEEPSPPMVYVNILRNPRVMVNLVVRSERPSLALVGAIREAIWSVDPQQTITRVTSLEQIVDDTLAAPRLITSAMVLFGGLGLLLGAVGIYGVLAYLVGQRRRELGIRLALGATQGNLLRWVLGRGVRLAALGVIAGLAGTLAAGRLVASMVYGVQPHDPLTLTAVCAVLFAVALLASYLPARRAMKVDPAETLRAE